MERRIISQFSSLWNEGKWRVSYTERERSLPRFPGDGRIEGMGSGHPQHKGVKKKKKLKKDSGAPQWGRVLVGAEAELGTPVIQLQGVSVSPPGGLLHPASPQAAVLSLVWRRVQRGCWG